MELLPNQFIIIPPHEFHRYQADVYNPWTIYWVHFSSDKLNEFNSDFNAKKYHAPTNILYNEKIIDTWIEMYFGLGGGYEADNIGYANLCLYRFLSFFIFPNRKPFVEEQESPVENQ